MEVHHHSTRPGNQSKKWTHYFQEFLMLFLAVFCGFLAENFREHQVEHQRERQYMELLVNDLKNDTAFLNTGFPRKEERIHAMDSVFLFFETHPNPGEIPGDVAVQMRRTAWDRIYDRNSGTITQLKNAGGLRLIRKKAVADSIAAYDLLWMRSEFWRDGYIYNQRQCYSFIEKIITAQSSLALFRDTARSYGRQRQLASIKINPEYLNEYLNFLYRLKGWVAQDRDHYENVKASAERLLALVKKEYHLN